MSKSPENHPETPANKPECATKTGTGTREARLAEALRANLRRRKQAARAGQGSDADSTDGADRTDSTDGADRKEQD